VVGGEEGDGNWNKSRLEINILYIHKKRRRHNRKSLLDRRTGPSRPPMTIGVEAAPLAAAASSSQLDCYADGEKCHSSPPLPIEETHCGRVVPCSFFIIYFPFFPRLSIPSSNIFLRHIKISQTALHRSTHNPVH
jgi:hypothetical protein